MKVLILGATGMLGHKLMQVLAEEFDVMGTIRGSDASYQAHPLLGKFHLLGDVQAENFDSVIKALAETRPDVVVNCIGIIKQHPNAKDPLQSIAINSAFPHRLAILCQVAGARMIHISTDCVFSGKRGNYGEEDLPDPEDIYGRSKLLGEVVDRGCLTLRTSMIGLELKERMGLVEWFIRQKEGHVRGFAGAIFTGFTTLALARIIAKLIDEQPDLQGLWHVSSDPISKYDLLGIVNRDFNLGINIERDNTFHCDRSLNSTSFRKATRFEPPSWGKMIREMTEDAVSYERLI